MKTLRYLLLVLMLVLPTQAQRFTRFVATVQAMKDLNTADVNLQTNGVVTVGGYYSVADGGGGSFVWNTASTGTTNTGTIFKGKTTGSELATGRWVRVNPRYTLLEFGAITGDGLTDDAALTNALSVTDQIVGTKGTYNFSTNIVIGTTKRLVLENGAVLKPASGIIIEFTGELVGPNAQCIDESASGRVIFSIDTKTPAANSLWWGADPTGNSDATSALRKWAYCGVAGLQMPHYLAPGAGYLVTGEIVLSNRVVVTGAGSSGSGGSTILCRPGVNESVFVGAPGANSIKISKILFSASSTAGTNSSAIRIGNSSNNHTWIYDNAFDGFRGFAIYNAGNSLYTKILQNRFLNCRNTLATSGNGLRPSGAIFSTNVFSATTIGWNTVTTSDMAYLFDGGATTNSGNITIISDSLEGNGGIGAMGTNVIAGTFLSGLSLIDVHSEHNTNHSLVYLAKSKSLNARDGLYSGDFNSVVMATNGFNFDGVEKMNLNGVRLSHFFSNFVLNASSTVPVRMRGVRFDNGGGAITDAEAAANISGAYELDNKLLSLAVDSLTVNGSTVTGNGPYFAQTADVTVNNSAAETTILGTVTGSKTLAVGVLTQGKLLHGIVRGRYGSDLTTPGTMRIKVKLGAVTILDSGAQTLPNNSTTKIFDIDYDIICRTTGGSGTVWAQGKVLLGDTSGLIPQVFPMVNTSTSTIDTTATQAVDVTVTFSVADADNTVTASIASLQ